MVKNPPCNAGDIDLTAGWGTKVPHAAEQLRTGAAATEVCGPQLESSCAARKEPAECTEEPVRHNEVIACRKT